MAEVSERELWSALQNALGVMRDSARGLALKRGDQRWLAIAGIADQAKDSCQKLFTKSQRQGSRALVTPPDTPLLLPGTPEFRRRDRDN